MKKTIIALLILLLFAGVLTSCSEEFPPNDKRVVLKLGGKKVHVDEYEHYYNEAYEDALLLKQYGEQLGIADDRTVEQMAYEITINNLRFKYGMYDLALDHYKKPSDDMLEEVRAWVQEYVDYYGGFDEYNQELAKYGKTVYSVYTYLLFQEFWENFAAYMIDPINNIIQSDDAKIVEMVNSDLFYAWSQCYISKSNGDSSAIAKKNTIIALLESGENFESVAKEKGDADADYNIKSGDYEISVVGSLYSIWEEQIMILDEGQYGTVFESEYGFHIFYRIEKRDEYTEDNFEKLRMEYQYYVFNNLVEEAGAKLTLEIVNEELLRK